MSKEERNDRPKTTPSVVLQTASRARVENSANVGVRLTKKFETSNPPKKRSAADTYFDREMCRFYWWSNYIQDDIDVLDEIVCGDFMGMLDKLHRIEKNMSGLPSVTDSNDVTIHDFRMQSL